VIKDGPALILSSLSFPGLQKELEMKDAVLAELKEEAAKKDQETRNDLRCELRHNQHESYSRYSNLTRLLTRPLHCMRALYMSSNCAFPPCAASSPQGQLCAYEAQLYTNPCHLTILLMRPL
jgi:hypothetical protein